MQEQADHKPGCDRFIPMRKELNNFDYKIMGTLNHKTPQNSRMLKNLFPFIEKNVLHFKPSHRAKENNFLSANDRAPINTYPTKLIKKGERKIYDAPEFKNDYYLHLIDAVDENLIGVILGNVAHIFHKEQNKVVSLQPLLEDSSHEPTSIAFHKASRDMLSIGTLKGNLQFWDWKAEKLVRSSPLHNERIGCIQGNPYNENIFATGSKDNKVILSDLKDPNMKMIGKSHFGEICGLSWNANGWVLASGGNDNLVNIWDIRNFKTPVVSLHEHKAAVRALAWCPWKSSLLATGGGSGDMRLLVTNVDQSKVVQEIHTSSQVCALLWDEEIQGIMTAHGFSKYQLSLWKYETSELIYEFLGHRNRILSMLRVPSNGSIITASADETIRVWNLKQFLKPYLKESSALNPILLR